MSNDEERVTPREAHLNFAKQFNGRVWQLLEKPDRSSLEDDEMLLAAYASLYHWLHVGTELHRQRGEWLVARVYVTLANAAEGVRHAKRCLELTQNHPSLMADFDVAFAYEGMARASALAGQREEALKYIEMARGAGERIADEEDREIFSNDFDGGEWFGVK